METTNTILYIRIIISHLENISTKNPENEYFGFVFVLK